MMCAGRDQHHELEVAFDDDGADPRFAHDGRLRHGRLSRRPDRAGPADAHELDGGRLLRDPGDRRRAQGRGDEQVDAVVVPWRRPPRSGVRDRAGDRPRRRRDRGRPGRRADAQLHPRRCVPAQGAPRRGVLRLGRLRRHLPGGVGAVRLRRPQGRTRPAQRRPGAAADGHRDLDVDRDRGVRATWGARGLRTHRQLRDRPGQDPARRHGDHQHRSRAAWPGHGHDAGPDRRGRAADRHRSHHRALRRHRHGAPGCGDDGIANHGDRRAGDTAGVPATSSPSPSASPPTSWRPRPTTSS